MTSTEFNIGLNGSKSSSRVLKPPGGGHTNIFGEAEVKVINPRPKYDQQNSSNLNFCMNTTDPNLLVDQGKCEVKAAPAPAPVSKPVEQPTPRPSAPAAAPPAPEPVQKPAAPAAAPPAREPSAPVARAAPFQAAEPPAPSQGKSRVPPGGFSSGLW